MCYGVRMADEVPMFDASMMVGTINGQAVVRITDVVYTLRRMAKNEENILRLADNLERMQRNEELR